MTPPDPDGVGFTVGGEADPAIDEAMARVDRWLDREHHRFPSHPLASPVATIFYALEARLAAEKSKARGQ